MSNDRIIWDKLLAAGLTPAGAAGLMGNLKPESGLEPKNLQNSYEKKLGYTDESYTAAVDCGAYTNFAYDGAGYGLAQWTHPSRKAMLLAWAKTWECSIGDLGMQVEFLLNELISSFRGVLAILYTTDSVREASDAVLLQFERPADQSKANCQRRAAIGQGFYEKFAKEGNSLKLYQCFLTENECYQDGVKIKPCGVMVHSTGCNNPLLRRYVQPVAQTAVATIGTAVAMGDVNWPLVASASLLAGVLSLCTSVAGLPEVE